MKRAATSGLVLVLCIATVAQEPDTTFKVDVKLVNVFVTVTDEHGAPIAGLKKENFDLLEDDTLEIELATTLLYQHSHYSYRQIREKVSGLSKDKVYLVHCAAGVRSARACQKMDSLGFEHLIDLAPGFRAWQQAGKPVEK